MPFLLLLKVNYFSFYFKFKLPLRDEKEKQIATQNNEFKR